MTTTEEHKAIQFKQVGFHIILQEWIMHESLENFDIALNGTGPHPWLDMLYDQAEIFSSFVSEQAAGGSKESAAFEEGKHALEQKIGPYPDGDMAYEYRRLWRKLVYTYYTNAGLIKPGERESDTWVKDHFDAVEEELRR